SGSMASSTDRRLETSKAGDYSRTMLVVKSVGLVACDPRASKAVTSLRVILRHAPHRSPGPLGDLPRRRALPRAPLAAAGEGVQRLQRLPATVQLRTRPPRRADRAGPRGVSDVEQRDVRGHRGA